MDFVWTTKSLEESADTTKAIYIDHINKDFQTGEKVAYVQKDKRKSAKRRKGKVVQCFKHHVLVQFENYKESFQYTEIEKWR